MVLVMTDEQRDAQIALLADLLEQFPRHGLLGYKILIEKKLEALTCPTD